MRHLGKKNVLGILVNAIDYDSAVGLILEAAQRRTELGVSALAVHGIMTGVLDPYQRFRLNSLDLVVPDGQPVRWGLNAIYHAGLTDRVYGPNLTLRVCERAAELSLPIYLYGSTSGVLVEFESKLRTKFPGISIAGAEPSKFRKLVRSEKDDLVERIQNSGAAIVLVGLGCPRQEVWAFEYKQALHMPILAVGAAFDFIGGKLPQAPKWMQDRGLEWLFRLYREPKRLWRRYLYLNPAYAALLICQASGLYHPDPIGREPVEELLDG